MLTEAERRRFSEIHEDEDLPDIRGRGFVRALFSKCRFKNMRKSHLVGCTMDQCTVETDDPRDILDVTLTLNCHTFRNLRLSPAAFDALLYVATMSAPDEETREKARAALDPERRKLFDRIFPTME